MSLVHRVRRQPRRRVGLFAVTVVAVLVASVVAIHGAAGSGSGPSVPSTGGASSATISGNLKLKVTRASYGYSGAAAPASAYTNVDAPITFNCASTSTCTFTNEGTVQVRDNGNSWAICLNVDTINNADCSWVGILPNDGYFTTESVSGTFPGLAPGPHTVVTQVYASAATTIEHFDLKYRSYNP